MTNSYKLPILIYDSECTMCTRFKQALERIDTGNEINFVSIHEDELYEAFPELNRDDCYDKVHLIDENRKIYVGASIVEVLKDKIPTINKLSWLLDKEATKKALNVFYEKVNEFRKSKLNPCKACHK